MRISDWSSDVCSSDLHLAHEFLALLVKIQRVDWKALKLDKLLGNPGAEASLFELVRWEGELRRVQLEPMPEMDLVLKWLRARARSCRASVLVHGDLKPGNALRVGENISAMLDGERGNMGDRMEDLGWITNQIGRRP